MRTRVTSFVLRFVGLSVAFAACSTPPPVTSLRPDCDAIVERCHPLDPGAGAIHDCHEFAENRETTNAQCVARRAACFASCVATDGGVTDAAAADTGG